MRILRIVFYTLLFTIAIAQQLFNPWNPNIHFKTDDKGNVWLGDDPFKFSIISKSSYP
ncbi:hypothetical protein KIN20_018762 [Parelaphostrongylus tenuis]|uniref:Uncharacterized protein n=1 Tax=Parelaphostrongylus tenuis TaxID=148309 RepID=A0AAD5MNH8_PARTN|nr:hypothetical protein KIN20_018762 [Parelaphostrongylus tenuis]